MIRALERAGFFVRRTRGSHYLFKHPDNPRLHVVVPYHSRDLSRKTLLGIVKSAGLTEEQFLELLQPSSAARRPAASRGSRPA